MRECGYCGKPILRRAKTGGREREYCNDVCRQLAYRKRTAWKHNLDRALKDLEIRMWDSVDQSIHREIWQDELKESKQKIEKMEVDIKYLEEERELLQMELKMRNEQIARLQFLLEANEEEITRLNYLLDTQSKKKHP